jgi:methyl-coenzyme M reductase subunit D
LNEDEIPYNPEVVIFPNRLCSDETVAKFLDGLKQVEGIIKVILQGPHTFDSTKRVIKVGKQELILDIQVGKFFVEIEQPEVIISIREVADEVFAQFGYRIGAGRYTKYQKTTMDYVRGYTLDFRKDILERDSE